MARSRRLVLQAAPAGQLLGDLEVVADPLRDEVGQARSDAATPRRAGLPSDSRASVTGQVRGSCDGSVEVAN